MVLEQLYNAIVSLINFFGLPGFFVAMIMQAIIAPIPSEALLILGGATFGTFLGGLVGSLGETTGAIFSFYISKKGGRPIVERLLGEKVLDFSDKWFQTYGGRAVFLGRLVPVIPFDAVSYGAGLTRISFKKFFAATFISSFPRAFFFSALGGFVADTIAQQGFISAFNNIMIILAGLGVTLIILQQFVVKRVRRKPLKNIQ